MSSTTACPAWAPHKRRPACSRRLPRPRTATTRFSISAVRSLGLYDTFVANVVAAAGVEVGYQRTGTLEVATTREHMAALEHLSVRLKSHGVALRLLDASAARAEEPHLCADVAGGLLIESHGFVNAGELTRGLAAAARRHGAEVVDGARALRISPRAGGVIVETSRGSPPAMPWCLPRAAGRRASRSKALPARPSGPFAVSCCTLRGAM